MTTWNEEESIRFRRFGAVAVPRRREMLAVMLTALPFGPDDHFRIVELGAGEGLLAEAVLEAFPRAGVVALDGSESMRDATAARTARFGDRVQVCHFDIAVLDWWDTMFGAGAVVSSLAVHHLNDQKKQYLYKAVADRLEPRGALIVADLIQPPHPVAVAAAADTWDASAADAATTMGRPERYEEFQRAGWNHFKSPDSADHPSAIFHQLVWMKHAGFAAVDCAWTFAGHAVLTGYKTMDASAGRIEGPHALAVVDDVLRRTS